MRLRKSRNDRIISGVCGGLAEGLGINSIWVRLLFVFGGGVLVWIYLILLFLMPND
ncbi:PspC domain-containing protein [Lacticaseibacillus sp. GG6-2]